MGKPSAPKPADPVAVANAQGAANADTARLQEKLNNVNTVGPTGSVTYSQTDPDRWQQTTTLSPAEQQSYNLTKAAENAALGVAGQQVGRVGSALGTPLSTAGLPHLEGEALEPHFLGHGEGGGYNIANAVPQLSSQFDQGQGVQGSVGQTNRQSSIAPAGNIQGSVANPQAQYSAAPSGQVQGSVAPSGQIASGFNQGPALQQSLGLGKPLASGFANTGTQSSIANPGAIDKSFNQGGSAQTSLANAGSLATGFNQGQAVQGQVNTGNPLTQSFQNTNVQGQVGPQDFNQSVNNVTSATLQQALSRLDPTYGKMQSDLDSKLANQGIGINSAAYGNAKDILGRQQNDAYNQAVYGAIQQGANEQNTLFGQNLAQGQFANQAAGQQYAQNQGQAQFQNDANLAQFGKNLQAGQFANTAAGQQYSQNQGAAAFQNTAQGQQFGENLQAGQFANAGQQQQYNQNQGQAQFANEAQNQQYNQSLGQANLYNSANAQQFGQNQSQAQFGNDAALADFQRSLSAGQFTNAAAGQQYAQNQGQAAFQNTAQQQAYGQNLSSGQFANSAQNQQFGENQQALAAYNQAAGQNFGQGVTAAQLGNSAQQQQFGQNAAQQQAYNQAQESLFNQNLAAGQFGNQAAGQQYQQGLGAAQFGQDTQNQNFQNLVSGTSAQNAIEQQVYNNQLSNSQLSNSARQQGLQEQAYVQNEPINQLSALLGLGQVGMPQGVQFSPTSVQPTDVLGAYALNAQQQQASYQAKMSGMSGLLGGLSSLGSAAITASDVRLKRDIRRAGFWNGIPLYYYRYIWDRILRVGVMAQDVLKVKPEAVVLMPSGYYAVDYGRL